MAGRTCCFTLVAARDLGHGVLKVVLELSTEVHTVYAVLISSLWFFVSHAFLVLNEFWNLYYYSYGFLIPHPPSDLQSQTPGGK